MLRFDPEFHTPSLPLTEFEITQQLSYSFRRRKVVQFLPEYFTYQERHTLTQWIHNTNINSTVSLLTHTINK
jgi:hypothetical protein